MKIFVFAMALWCALIIAPKHVFAQHLRLWHAMRGDEQHALEAVVHSWREGHPGVTVDVLALPFDAYASKLESAIPRGHGPDVFIDAHERLASYVSRRLISPLPNEEPLGDYLPVALTALGYQHQTWAFPLAIKCVALYVNTHFVPSDGLHGDRLSLLAIEGLTHTLPAGVFALAYEAQNPYFHAAVLHAYGGAYLDERGRYAFIGEAAERSVERVLAMTRSGVIPQEPSGALVSRLFSTGRAATVISGPWLAAEIGTTVPYTVVPLPSLGAGSARVMQPFATVDGVFVSAHSHERELARELARYVSGPEASVVRARVGRQVVANQRAWERDPELGSDWFLLAFRRAAERARPMPTQPAMRAAWEPARQAIAKVLRGELRAREALEQGRHRFEDVTRPLPARRSATGLLLLLGLGALGVVLSVLGRVRDSGFRAEVKRSVRAYVWVAHAAVAVVVLVVAPLVVGAVTSLYATRNGESFYVGLANYWDILTARGGGLLATGSFYRVLLVTVLWTAVNLGAHLAIGVSLALLLSRPALRFRAVYRVVLILPWAVPSYVTALAWKGMFHRQFGAINAVIMAVGGEPVSWFARFSTAFTANVATNVWLGFPFMMVVAIGALAAIPKELYEAAEVDGASWWQKLTKITLPMLRPTLGPAAALGAIWTFNQFNVVFLVSGGEPDGETEILVSEAYRWAFTRQAQYGYASAYAVLIFVMLYWVSRRKGAEA